MLQREIQNKSASDLPSHRDHHGFCLVAVHPGGHGDGGRGASGCPSARAFLGRLQGVGRYQRLFHLHRHLPPGRHSDWGSQLQLRRQSLLVQLPSLLPHARAVAHCQELAGVEQHRSGRPVTNPGRKHVHREWVKLSTTPCVCRSVQTVSGSTAQHCEGSPAHLQHACVEPWVGCDLHVTGRCQ